MVHIHTENWNQAISNPLFHMRFLCSLSEIAWYVHVATFNCNGKGVAITGACTEQIHSNGQKVNLTEMHAGGGPETRIKK